MTTFETSENPAVARPSSLDPGSSAPLSSPFALTVPTETSRPAIPTVMSSPFLEGLSTESGWNTGEEATHLLLAELEDEEFAEALEALADEGAARTARSPLLWGERGGVPTLDPTDAEQWMEAVASRAIETVEELERHFGDRTVESVGDDELDQLLDDPLGGIESYLDPLDAQELFFKKLKKKLKKVVKGAKNLVKKGIEFASKVMPINIILKRLRGLIRPLLRRVLAKAIGKLPKNLQDPARRLARKYGLQREVAFETDFEYLAAEFDAEVVEALLASESEFASLEAEMQAESQVDAMEPSLPARLDLARRQLGQALEEAEPGVAPVEAMEQFVPMALLPIVKMGVKVAGRKRIISFVAGLLARLIAPVVGRQLARPLATQIADKGLGLLGLEAESGQDRLGSEAVVAAAEEAIGEVFELPEQWLEDERLLEMAVQEAFEAAALRHFPASALRPGVAARRGRDGGGVWMMMPRSTGPAYRYKQYSERVPVVLTPELARSVVFDGGETLEERLYDEGIDSWPVDGEVEFYELLPGAELGHLVAGDQGTASGAAVAPDQVAAATLEFDIIEDPGGLPLPEGERRRRQKRQGPSRRRGRGGQRSGGAAARGRGVARITARGRALRRKSPVSIRLDLAGAEPTVRLDLLVGERRAIEIVEKLGDGQQPSEALALFTRMTEGPVRSVIARRLRAMFTKRQLTVEEGASQALSDRLFDGLVAALGAQIQQLAPSLGSAAKDPAPGLTITATFRFASKEALTTGEPEPPTLTVRPGRHRG